MIPVLGIPFYNRPELLSRCLSSIDEPIERLVIVDNSPEGMRQEERYGLYEACAGFAQQTIYIRHPNAGVAASWNEIIKLFPAPWWLLVNNDIVFAPGDLAKMAAACRTEPGCFYGNHGASFWIVTAHGVAQVGLFDENFFPAYLEDCDWSRRADLLGVRRVNVPDIHAEHGEHGHGSCTVNATREMQAWSMRTHGANHEYYRRKWGGQNEKEVFGTPFNDPHWPIAYWRFEPEFRAQQQGP